MSGQYKFVRTCIVVENVHSSTHKLTDIRIGVQQKRKEYVQYERYHMYQIFEGYKILGFHCKLAEH